MERLMQIDPLGYGRRHPPASPPPGISNGEGTMELVIVVCFDFFWWLKR